MQPNAPASSAPAVVNVTVNDPKTLMGDIGDSAMESMSQMQGGKGGQKMPKGQHQMDPQSMAQEKALEKLKKAIDAQAAAQKAQIEYMWANKQAEEAVKKPGAQNGPDAPKAPGSEPAPAPEPAPAMNEQNPFKNSNPAPPSFLPGQAPPVQIPPQGPKQ